MIQFKELSLPIKIGVIGGWVIIVVYTISFIVGLIMGLIGG